jgi:hypothetical protein
MSKQDVTYTWTSRELPILQAALRRVDAGEIVDATLDPHDRGYRAGPQAGGLRLDDRQALVGLTPDLRGAGGSGAIRAA